MRQMRRPITSLLWLAVCLLLAACGSSDESGNGAARVAHPTRPDILIVSIDTLRPDHLGCYGYERDTSPTIDRLAQESVLFERALAPMSMTLPSHTSLLTGTFPLEHGVLANIKHGGHVFIPAPGLRSFAEFAQERGYLTAGFVSAPPLSAVTGIAAGFEKYDEPEKSRIAGETNRRVFEWLDDHDGSDAPLLLWVHYFDPHASYNPPEDFDLFANDENLRRTMERRQIAPVVLGIRGKRFDTAVSINKYDGEVRYVDSELDRLINRLDAAGRWKDTVLILVSDHGESLGDHDLIGHEYITREQLQILMMLRIPGVAAQRITQPVSIVDALPTAAHRMGGADWSDFLDQVSGIDAMRSPPRALLSQRAERERADFIGPAYTLLDGRWQYVYEPGKSNRLFDWDTDPHELEDRLSDNEALQVDLEGRLLQQIADFQRRGRELRGDAPSASEMDPLLYEKLKALGYID